MSAGFDRARRRLRVLLRLVTLAVLAVSGDVVCRMRMRRSTIGTITAIASLQAASMRLIGTLGVRVVVEGAPPPGRWLFVANHRSYVDIPLLLAHVRAVFLSKKEIGDWPHRAVVSLADRLDRGYAIAVFPEGTTSHGPGLQTFRWGSFRLAAARGVGVIPIALAYADRNDAWVGDDEFVRHFLERFAEPRMRVTIAFGPPLYDTDGPELAARAEQWIRQKLAELDRVPFGSAITHHGQEVVDAVEAHERVPALLLADRR